MSTVKSFKDLEIWQLAVELGKKIHDFTETGIVSKDPVFKDKINIAANSIADHIAEGYRRSSWLEFIRYLNKARKSASEVNAQLEVGLKKYLFSKELFDELSVITETIGNKAPDPSG